MFELFWNREPQIFSFQQQIPSVRIQLVIYFISLMVEDSTLNTVNNWGDSHKKEYWEIQSVITIWFDFSIFFAVGEKFGNEEMEIDCRNRQEMEKHCFNYANVSDFFNGGNYLNFRFEQEKIAVNILETMDKISIDNVYFSSYGWFYILCRWTFNLKAVLNSSKNWLNSESS